MASSDTAPPARVRNARGEGDRLREQLVAAAVTLLEAEGDANRLSVRAIAKKAGVSPTALYLHFPDRDALVSAAVDRGFSAFNEVIQAAAASADEPRSRLRAMGIAYLDFVDRQGELYAVIFSARRTMAQAETTTVDRGAALDALIDAVAAVQGSGTRDDTRDLALTIWAALHGYCTLRDRSPVGGWPGHADYVDGLLRAHLGA